MEKNDGWVKIVDEDGWWMDKNDGWIRMMDR